MKQISRESPPTVPVRPRVSSNFYAMLQYSMTNKVSLTRRCCSRAESSTSMTTSRAIAVHGFWGVGGFAGDTSPLSLPVQNLMRTTELFSARRHSVYVIACVFSSLFPAALCHATCALIQNNCFSFSPGAPSSHCDTFPRHIYSKCSWLFSVGQGSVWLVSCCKPV